MAETMERAPRRLRVVSVTGLVVLGLAVFAGSASAAPSETPNGWTGACNMMQAVSEADGGSSVAVKPGGGMVNAMTVNNPNGNAGMYRAVANSGGTC
jgi:hypothetical protein